MPDPRYELEETLRAIVAVLFTGMGREGGQRGWGPFPKPQTLRGERICDCKMGTQMPLPSVTRYVTQAKDVDFASFRLGRLRMENSRDDTSQSDLPS